MDFYDILLAKKLSCGGGSSVDVEALSVTANGTYTAEEGKAYSPVTVNVSGWTTDGIIDGTEPNGKIVSYATSMRSYAFAQCPNITSIIMMSLTTTKGNSFNMATIPIIVLPSVTEVGMNGVNSWSGATLDIGENCTKLKNSAFNSSTNLNVLILRRTSIVAMENVNAMSSTKFKSGGAGGEIYIPKSLYDHLGDGTSSDYKSATNWITYEGYGTITWKKIEGSVYENAYADGTPIGA